MTRNSADHFCFALFIAVLLSMAALPPSARAQGCAGDCSGDQEVTVDEVLTAIQIALGERALALCPAGDSDGSGSIAVDDILRAIDGALNGCMPILMPPTPTPTVGPTPTAAIDALGTRRFDLDPAASVLRVYDQLGTPFAGRVVGPVRGANGGSTINGHLELRGGVPNRAGVATIDVIGGSQFLYADATTELGGFLCLAPDYPAERAGIVDCDGGTKANFEIVLDHKPGQLGVVGFTEATCDALGGTIESQHQICANVEQIGEPCRSDADCNGPPTTPNGVCGLMTATCSRGLVGPCRADADCDTSPTNLDGICGREDPHPGICNAPVRLDAVGGGRPGDAVIAPLDLAELELSGLPARLSFEAALPCGDEGEGELVMLALTTGESHTTVIDFSVLLADAELRRTGAPLSCSQWSADDGGTFLLSLPRLHATTDQTDVIYLLELVGAAAP